MRASSSPCAGSSRSRRSALASRPTWSAACARRRRPSGGPSSRRERLRIRSAGSSPTGSRRRRWRAPRRRDWCRRPRDRKRGRPFPGRRSVRARSSADVRRQGPPDPSARRRRRRAWCLSPRRRPGQARQLPVLRHRHHGGSRGRLRRRPASSLGPLRQRDPRSSNLSLRRRSPRLFQDRRAPRCARYRASQRTVSSRGDPRGRHPRASDRRWGRQARRRAGPHPANVPAIGTRPGVASCRKGRRLRVRQAAEQIAPVARSERAPGAMEGRLRRFH